MRVWKLLAITAIALGMIAGRTNAQEASSPKVGVIDIGYIFENHPTMKSRLEAIDAQIAQAEETINAKREQILGQAQSLQKLEESSPEYATRQEQIASQESKLKLDFVRKEKEFAEAKAAVIYETYQQVDAQIRSFAQHNGMDVVLRYQRQEMDPKKPATVSVGVSKTVLYFNPSYDLTDPILNLIRQQSGAPAAQNAQNGGRRVQ